MGLRLPLCPQQVLRHVQAVKKNKEKYLNVEMRNALSFLNC